MHSANPVGARRMLAVIGRAGRGSAGLATTGPATTWSRRLDPHAGARLVPDRSRSRQEPHFGEIVIARARRVHNRPHDR